MCPTEITAFSDRYAEFKAMNTEVLGVSVDSQFSHLAWIQTDRKEGGLGDLAYPLVADLKKASGTGTRPYPELRQRTDSQTVRTLSSAIACAAACPAGDQRGLRRALPRGHCSPWSVHH